MLAVLRMWWKAEATQQLRQREQRPDGNRPQFIKRKNLASCWGKLSPEGRWCVISPFWGHWENCADSHLLPGVKRGFTHTRDALTPSAQMSALLPEWPRVKVSLALRGTYLKRKKTMKKTEFELIFCINK